MKNTMNTLKPHAAKIISGLIILIVVVVIIIIAVTAPKKSSAPGTEPTVTTPETGVTTTKPSTTPPTIGTAVIGTEPYIIPYTAKATLTVDPDADTHGSFSVIFTIDPSNKDIVFSPTCKNGDGTTFTDGVAFSFIRDGAHVTNPNLSQASCVVLNRGTATKTADGYFLIKAGQQNPFELIVVNNPSDGGKYSLQLTNIAYRRSAKSVPLFFKLSPQTLSGLKTNTITL